MYSWTVLDVVSRFYIFSSPDILSGKETAAIVRFEKKYPKLHLQLLLYFLPDFEYNWTYMLLPSWRILPLYVITKLKNSSLLLISGTFARIIPSTKVIYSWMLSLLKIGAFKIHLKEWICGLPQTWNSTLIA